MIPERNLCCPYLDTSSSSATARQLFIEYRDDESKMKQMLEQQIATGGKNDRANKNVEVVFSGVPPCDTNSQWDSSPNGRCAMALPHHRGRWMMSHKDVGVLKFVLKPLWPTPQDDGVPGDQGCPYIMLAQDQNPADSDLRDKKQWMESPDKTYFERVIIVQVNINEHGTCDFNGPEPCIDAMCTRLQIRRLDDNDRMQKAKRLALFARSIASRLRPPILEPCLEDAYAAWKVEVAFRASETSYERAFRNILDDFPGGIGTWDRRMERGSSDAEADNGKKHNHVFSRSYPSRFAIVTHSSLFPQRKNKHFLPLFINGRDFPASTLGTDSVYRILAYHSFDLKKRQALSDESPIGSTYWILKIGDATKNLQISNGIDSPTTNSPCSPMELWKSLLPDIFWDEKEQKEKSVSQLELVVTPDSHSRFLRWDDVQEMTRDQTVNLSAHIVQRGKKKQLVKELLREKLKEIKYESFADRLSEYFHTQLSSLTLARCLVHDAALRENSFSTLPVVIIFCRVNSLCLSQLRLQSTLAFQERKTGNNIESPRIYSTTVFRMPLVSEQITNHLATWRHKYDTHGWIPGGARRTAFDIDVCVLPAAMDFANCVDICKMTYHGAGTKLVAVFDAQSQDRETIVTQVRNFKTSFGNDSVQSIFVSFHEREQIKPTNVDTVAIVIDFPGVGNTKWTGTCNKNLSVAEICANILQSDHKSDFPAFTLETLIDEYSPQVKRPSAFLCWMGPPPDEQICFKRLQVSVATGRKEDPPIVQTLCHAITAMDIQNQGISFFVAPIIWLQLSKLKSTANDASDVVDNFLPLQEKLFENRQLRFTENLDIKNNYQDAWHPLFAQADKCLSNESSRNYLLDEWETLVGDDRQIRLIKTAVQHFVVTVNKWRSDGHADHANIAIHDLKRILINLSQGFVPLKFCTTEPADWHSSLLQAGVVPHINHFFLTDYAPFHAQNYADPGSDKAAHDPFSGVGHKIAIKNVNDLNLFDALLRPVIESDIGKTASTSLHMSRRDQTHLRNIQNSFFDLSSSCKVSWPEMWEPVLFMDGEYPSPEVVYSSLNLWASMKDLWGGIPIPVPRDELSLCYVALAARNPIIWMGRSRDEEPSAGDKQLANNLKQNTKLCLQKKDRDANIDEVIKDINDDRFPIIMECFASVLGGRFVLFHKKRTSEDSAIEDHRIYGDAKKKILFYAEYKSGDSESGEARRIPYFVLLRTFIEDPSSTNYDDAGLQDALFADLMDPE